MTITLVVAPAQLKMETTASTAAVTVTAPGAKRLRLWCSAGDVSRPEVLDGERFAATYLPPPSGKPTYAVLAAWDEDTGEAATATVALGARTEIPVQTEAGAQVVAVVHGRRSTARANAAGHARVLAWVWPGDNSATVTALDAAGNATSSEVPLELPRPDGVFLLAPPQAAVGAPVRVYAFATGAAEPRLSAPGAQLAAVAVRPGAASALLYARDDVTLTAAVGDERVQQRIRVAGLTPPPERSIALTTPPPALEPPPAPAPPAPAPAATTAGPTTAVVRVPPERPLSSWELGVALSGRYAGTLVGGGGAIEARRRLRRFALGVDLVGHYAAGTLHSDDATVGGVTLRLAAEARFVIATRVALFVSATAGGGWARVRRVPPARPAFSGNDGGPTLGATAGVLARLGPGLFEIAAGYAWTPLVGAGLANLDGAVLTVGYRAARWRRRGGGRRRVRRRRRARGR